MHIGAVVGCMLVTGAPGIMKFPVAPASATALSTGMLMVDIWNAVCFLVAE
jgi:hypothetical protein